MEVSSVRVRVTVGSREDGGGSGDREGSRWKCRTVRVRVTVGGSEDGGGSSGLGAAGGGVVQ